MAKKKTIGEVELKPLKVIINQEVVNGELVPTTIRYSNIRGYSVVDGKLIASDVKTANLTLNIADLDQQAISSVDKILSDTFDSN
jgi:hypothetical protein